MKRLRGTRLDVFGMTAECRMERALIDEFEPRFEEILQNLVAHNLDAAADVLNEYLEIRGFGPVKEAAADQSRKKIQTLLAGFRGRRKAAA